MTVGERIKKIRIFRKITMDEFGAAEDIIETLWGLEESVAPTTGKHSPEYQTPGNLIRLATMKPVTNDDDVKLTYNDIEYMASCEKRRFNYAIQSTKF